MNRNRPGIPIIRPTEDLLTWETGDRYEPEPPPVSDWRCVVHPSGAMVTLVSPKGRAYQKCVVDHCERFERNDT